MTPEKWAAVFDALDSKTKSYRALAAEYDVSSGIIHKRYRKRDARNLRKGPAPALGIDGEAAIGSWLVTLDQLRLNPTPKRMRQQARAFAKSVGLPDFAASKHWYQNFMQRAEIFSGKTAKDLPQSRRKAIDPEGVKAFFDNVKKFIIDKGVPAKKIFNVDETGIELNRAPRQVRYRIAKSQGASAPPN
jgi:hypothetical protein